MWNRRWLFWTEVFFWGSAAPEEKYRRSKTITDEFTQWPKQRWCKVIIVINNRYFDNFVCFMCIFFWQKHVENSIFYHFCTHPCKRISISPDVTIIARWDKCAKTGCIARDYLCVYAFAQMALAIMPTSHAEVIIRSHCYVIMTAQSGTFYIRDRNFGLGIWSVTWLPNMVILVTAPSKKCIPSSGVSDTENIARKNSVRKCM